MASAYVQARGRLVHRGLRCTVHYDPDKKGMARCAVGKELTADVLKLAQKALRFAKTVSPPRSHKAGKVHYRDAFILVPGTVSNIGKPPMRRVAVKLINTSPQAKIVEVGTARSPKYEVLRKTLDHLNGSNPLRQ